MPSRAKRAINGALLGAAATALTVKTALTGPVGALAQEPLDALKHGLDQTASAALAPITPSKGETAARQPSATPETAQPPAASSEPIQPPVSLDAVKRVDRGYSPALVKRILREAAHRHHLDPKLVLALSYWESGWDQSRVSGTGAVGLMQVEPYAAETAGPKLLGRPVDISDPYDNADVGAAIFREDLNNFGDPAMALAAYYQGPSSLEQNGMLPDTQAYVNGIMALASRIDG